MTYSTSTWVGCLLLSVGTLSIAQPKEQVLKGEQLTESAVIGQRGDRQRGQADRANSSGGPVGLRFTRMAQPQGACPLLDGDAPHGTHCRVIVRHEVEQHGPQRLAAAVA